MQLGPSEAEKKAFGIKDHYELSEREKMVRAQIEIAPFFVLSDPHMQAGAKKNFRTPDENVGFAERKFG